MSKRYVDIVVISDTHLGTIGCHAAEILEYLNSINPRILVLNGDIIDIWQFSKRYWPQSHSAVIQKIIQFINEGTEVYYLTGNHDDALRKFSEFEIGNFKLCDKLVLEIDNKKAWIFHGDVFDVSINYAKWMARLGSVGYDTLILINRIVNFILEKLGREKYSFSKKIKQSVKKAVSFVGDFEKIASELAIEKGYDYVVCGHIHQAQKRIIENPNGQVLYLNSGDWVESLTALEYNNGYWSIYTHEPIKRNTKEEVYKKKTFTVFTEEINLAFASKLTE